MSAEATPLPPRYWRKVVAAIQGIVLTVAAADVLPRAVTEVALAIAAASCLPSRSAATSGGPGGTGPVRQPVPSGRRVPAAASPRAGGGRRGAPSAGAGRVGSRAVGVAAVTGASRWSGWPSLLPTGRTS